MKRLVRAIKSQLQQISGVERFVQLIVGGGLALVAGLWLTTISSIWSFPWLLGAVLVLLGMGGLAGGIGNEIDY